MPFTGTDTRMLLNKPQIDHLRQSIRQMTRASGLYKALKEELSALGYWKNLKRGKPDISFIAKNSEFTGG